MARRESSNTQLSVRPPGTLAVPAADPTYFLPKVETGRILGGILRRGWLVVLFGAIGIGLALFYVKGATKVYRAAGSVYVGTQAPQVLNIQAIAPEESRDLEQMRSVEQGMLATTLLMRLIEVHGLANNPTFAPPGTGPEALLKILGSRVTVALRRGTRIIDITVDDTEPARARLLVESIVTEYQKWTTERQTNITQLASEGLSDKEKLLREKMEQSAKKLQDFRQDHRVPGLEMAQGGVPANEGLAAVTSQLSQAKSERMRLESEYEAFRKFDPADPSALGGIGGSEQATEVVAQVRAIQQKEADFAALKERYLELHPVYRTAASELALLKKNLADTAKTAGEALEKKYRIAKENESKLETALADTRGEVVDVEGLREQFRALSRDADADRTLYDSVAARLRETALAGSVPASVLRWEDTPMTPEKPHSPRKLVALALGMTGGCFCGLVLMVFLELTDGKIRDVTSAARATGVPLLVRIPASGASDAFRQLRAVLSPDGISSARTILFASAQSGEGRSFCARNYATSLAIQGHRTLLLDADLRTAGLSSAHLNGFGAGLGDFLAGDVAPSQACFATEHPNLYLLSSGAPRGDAGDLLAGTRFAALLEDSYRWFDKVVIDTPPLLSSADATAIARYADRCCLVVADKGNEKRGLQRAAEMLRSSGGSLVGFVWNEVSANGRNTDSRNYVIPKPQASLPYSPNAIVRRSPNPDGLAS